MEKKPILVMADKVRLELNQLLHDARLLLEETQKQESAGVPGMDQVSERCQSCIDRVTTFKEVNFPGKK